MENKIIELTVVDSTQNYIKANKSNLNFYDSCYALTQTAGYGRTGNWDSSYENLYYSKLLPIDKHNHLTGINSMHMLVAKYAPHIEIKVPNDLYYMGIKMGGVIVENYDDYAVLGIGININGSRPEFTSLAAINGCRYQVDQLVQELDDLVNLNLTMSIEMLESYYRQNCKIIGTKVDYIELTSNDTFSGIVNDIDSEFITIDNIKFNQMQIKLLSKQT